MSQIDRPQTQRRACQCSSRDLTSRTRYIKKQPNQKTIFHHLTPLRSCSQCKPPKRIDPLSNLIKISIISDVHLYKIGCNFWLILVYGIDHDQFFGQTSLHNVLWSRNLSRLKNWRFKLICVCVRIHQFNDRMQIFYGISLGKNRAENH